MRPDGLRLALDWHRNGVVGNRARPFKFLMAAGAPRAIRQVESSFRVARVGSSLGGQVTVVKRVVPGMAFPLGKRHPLVA